MAINVSIPREFLAKRYSRYYLYLEPVVRDPLIRGYFSFVASLFLVAFLSVFALSPTVNTILTLQKKISEQRKVVADLNSKIEAIVLAEQNYSQIESSLPILLSALPGFAAPETIIAGITTFASSSGVTVSGLSFRELPLSLDQLPKERSTVDFSFVSGGPTNKIRDFLGKVESFPRQIHMTNITIGKGAESTLDLVSVAAVGYYLPENSND